MFETKHLCLSKFETVLSVQKTDDSYNLTVYKCRKTVTFLRNLRMFDQSVFVSWLQLRISLNCLIFLHLLAWVAWLRFLRNGCNFSDIRQDISRTIAICVPLFVSQGGNRPRLVTVFIRTCVSTKLIIQLKTSEK